MNAPDNRGRGQPCRARRRPDRPAVHRLAMGLALAVIAPLACAATPSGQPPQHRPRKKGIKLAPIIVTAPMQDSPLTVITRPKAPRQPVPASDGADFLKTIPGFNVIRKGGSNGDPVLRGMAGSRLGILVDGGRIGGGGTSRMDPPTAYISPKLYDRAIVIKGPETVLYGPGNSAGIVRFERDFERYEAPGYSVYASALGGSWDRADQTADLRAGAPIGYLGVSTNHTHSGDYQDGDGHPVHSRYDRWNVDTTIGWTPDGDDRVELGVGTGNGRAAYASTGMDGVRFLRRSASLKWIRQHLAEHWDRLEVQAYVNEADHVMNNYSMRKPDPMSMMPMPMATNVHRRIWGGRLAGTWRWGDALKLIAGLDGSSSLHTGRTGGLPGSMAGWWKAMPRTRDAAMDDVGAFGQARWTFAPRQRLIAGARADRAYARGYDLTPAGMGRGGMSGGMDGGVGNMGGMDSMTSVPSGLDASRSATLPAGFVRYERDLAHAPATFYAGIGHVTRFPDFWELFGADKAPTVAGFRAVRPEKTTQLDVGLQYHRRHLRAWVSAYYGQVDDFILLHYPTMGGRYASNVQARIAGGEAGAAYRFSAHWKGDATVSYAWGRDRTEKRPLPQMPPLEARLGLTWEHGAWSVGGLWRAVAAQPRVATGEGNVVGQDLGPSPGFGVFSLNGGYRFGDAFTLTAGIDNLFDTAYAEHLNAVPAAVAGYFSTQRVNEPGRTGWVKLEMDM